MPRIITRVLEKREGEEDKREDMRERESAEEDFSSSWITSAYDWGITVNCR